MAAESAWFKTRCDMCGCEFDMSCREALSVCGPAYCSEGCEMRARALSDGELDRLEYLSRRREELERGQVAKVAPGPGPAYSAGEKDVQDHNRKEDELLTSKAALVLKVAGALIAAAVLAWLLFQDGLL